MVLLYMVCHGSHQYSPNVSIYTSTMDPMGTVIYHQDIPMVDPLFLTPQDKLQALRLDRCIHIGRIWKREVLTVLKFKQVGLWMFMAKVIGLLDG